MILIIAFLFIIILGSGIVSLGLEDYKRMREERVGLAGNLGLVNLICFYIKLDYKIRRWLICMVIMAFV